MCQKISEGLGGTACAPVSECLPGTEEALAPTRARDRVCTSCPDGTFNADPQEGTRCQPWRTCAAGEEVATPPPTPSSDRVCSACAQDVGGVALAFKANEGNFACTAVRECAPGTEESEPPTATSDRRCEACGGGTFSKGGANACRAWSSCGMREYIRVPGNQTHDRVCANVTVCDPATQYVVEEAGVQADRVCADLTECGDNEFELRPPERRDGVVVADRVCAECRTGCPGGSTPLAPCTASMDMRTC